MNYNEIKNPLSSYIYVLTNGEYDKEIYGVFTSYSAAIHAKKIIGEELEIEKYLNGDNIDPNITGYTAYYNIKNSTLEVKESEYMFECLLSKPLYNKYYELISIEIPNTTKEEAIERAKQVISLKEGIDINKIKYKPSSVEEIFKDF